MELLELLSSHVTVPVIGVVLCALMVFTFGFRSPAQPPSFTFEEHPEKRNNKKRSKQAKIKSSNNGSVKITDLSADTLSKATTESPKAGRVTSKPKSEIRKEATQDLKGEKKLKAKKEGKGGVKIHNLQADDAPVVKKEAEEGGEWTTIQVSKKSKKAKPSKKESSGQAEPVVEAQHDSDSAPEIELVAVADVSSLTATTSPAFAADTSADTAISPSITTDTAADTAVSPAITAEVPTSPESNRNKNKKRKEKVLEKKQAEEKDAPTDAVDLKPVPAESNKPQSEEHGKNKNKKNKKPSSEASASVSETVVPNEPLVPGATETKDVYQISIPVDAPELANVEQAKPVQKNKKHTGKEMVQKEVSPTAPDMQIRQPEKSHEAAEDSLTSVPSKAVKPADIESDVSPSERHPPSPVTASQPPVGISFDEIGDVWVDAAPKSKKKKARRDN